MSVSELEKLISDLTGDINHGAREKKQAKIKSMILKLKEDISIAEEETEYNIVCSISEGSETNQSPFWSSIFSYYTYTQNFINLCNEFRKIYNFTITYQATKCIFSSFVAYAFL